MQKCTQFALKLIHNLLPSQRNRPVPYIRICRYRPISNVNSIAYSDAEIKSFDVKKQRGQEECILAFRLPPCSFAAICEPKEAPPQTSGACATSLPNESRILTARFTGIQHSPNRQDQLQQLMRISAMTMIHRQLLPSNRLHKQFISVPPFRRIASRWRSPLGSHYYRMSAFRFL